MMNDLTLPYDAKLQQESESAPYDFAADSKGSPKFELKSSSSQKSSKPDQQKNSYEEIQGSRSRVPGSNAYETIDLVFNSPSFSESDDSSGQTSQDVASGKEYRFATEMPSVGVPEPFDSSRTSSQISENSSDSEDADEKDDTPIFNGVSEETDVTAISNDSPAIKNEPIILTNDEVNGVEENEKNIYNSVRSYSLKGEGSEEHYQSPGSLFSSKDKFFPNGTSTSEDIYAAPCKTEQAN